MRLAKASVPKRMGSNKTLHSDAEALRTTVTEVINVAFTRAYQTEINYRGDACI